MIENNNTNDDILIIDKKEIKKIKKQHKEAIKKEDELNKGIKILKGTFIINFD